MSRIFEDLKTGLSEVDGFLAGTQSGFQVTAPPNLGVKSARKDLQTARPHEAEIKGDKPSAMA